MRASPPYVAIALSALIVLIGGALVVFPTMGDLEAYFAPETLRLSSPCEEGGRDTQPTRHFDDFRVEWYAGVWRAAGEPSLHARSLDPARRAERAYRFTWLRSFHQPVIVTIEERAPDQFHLRAKLLSGKGGYAPGQVVRSIERPLTRAEVSSILKTINDAALMEAETADCPVGADGAEWIFEGVEAGKLHVVERWSPDAVDSWALSPQDPLKTIRIDRPSTHLKAMRDVGIAFLDLTGWALSPIY